MASSRKLEVFRVRQMHLVVSPSFHQNHGPLVDMSCSYNPVNHTDQHDCDKHYNRPVKFVRSHRRSVWPEAPEEAEGGVCQAACVYGNTILPQAPAAFREQLRVIHSSVEDAGNGDLIRNHEGHQIEGDDCVTAIVVSMVFLVRGMCNKLTKQRQTRC